MEDERRRLAAAWLQVHKAQRVREEELPCAAEQTGSSVAAAEERLTTATEIEKRAERARLELLEEGLAAHEKELAAQETALNEEEATLKATMDALLVMRRDALDAEHLQKAKEIRAQQCGEYEAKIKKQEERQAGKVHELNEKLSIANQEVQQRRQERDSVHQEASAAGAERNAVLAQLEEAHRERDEMLQYIEELKAEQEIVEVLGEHRHDMLRDLIKRAQRVCARLSGEHLGVPNAF